VTSVVAFEGEGKWVEYAGGYSDMVARRGAGVGVSRRVKPQAAKLARGARPETTRPRPATQARKRLSPTEQHALKTAPARIASLTEEIGRLEGLLADPLLYARDREGFAAVGDQLTKAQADLAAAEEEWLRLELLREEVQGT
jgi:ATP-binding cassette subfamily F protein uup